MSELIVVLEVEVGEGVRQERPASSRNGRVREWRDSSSSTGGKGGRGEGGTNERGVRGEREKSDSHCSKRGQ
jgi:hypothetical protein